MTMAINPQPPLNPTPPAPDPASDVPFKRMITVSTALSLGAAYGWLAGFVREANGDFSFHWRWLVALWAVIGFLSTAFFWRKVWPPPQRPAATRRDIVIGAMALGVPAVWWLLLPLRSYSGEHFREVMTGLTAAALVLTFGAWMVMRLGRAFEADKPDGPNGGSDKE